MGHLTAKPKAKQRSQTMTTGCSVHCCGYQRPKISSPVSMQACERLCVHVRRSYATVLLQEQPVKQATNSESGKKRRPLTLALKLEAQYQRTQSSSQPVQRGRIQHRMCMRTDPVLSLCMQSNVKVQQTTSRLTVHMHWQEKRIASKSHAW